MYQTTEQSVAGSFINFEAQQALLPQLSHQEHLIWAGRPRQGVFLQPQDIFMIPFSLAWGGFALFWTYSAWRGGAPWFFVLWGAPFVLVGLYMMFGRFLTDARTRARTFYGLTDQRILFVRGAGKAVTSLELKSLADTTYTQNATGRGTILFGFGGQNQQMARSAMMFNKGSSLVPMFVGIERVKEVYEQIRQAKDNLQAGQTH